MNYSWKSLHKNLIHYYLMAHFALPELKKSKGAIVNITSKTAETGQGGTSAYAAANGGRNALTREWAVEMLKYGIRVNAIVVAECWTPLYESWIKTLPNPDEKVKRNNFKNSFGKKNDNCRRNCECCCVFIIAEIKSYNRTINSC